MTWRIVLLLGALILTGCARGNLGAGPTGEPVTAWDSQACALRGGYWNRIANVCEATLPR